MLLQSTLLLRRLDGVCLQLSGTPFSHRTCWAEGRYVLLPLTTARSRSVGADFFGHFRPHRGHDAQLKKERGVIRFAYPPFFFFLAFVVWRLVSPRSNEQLLAKMTSKLNSELVSKAVDDILAYSAGETIKRGDAEIVGKKRKFTESVELQVSPVYKLTMHTQSAALSWNDRATPRHGHALCIRDGVCTCSSRCLLLPVLACF